MPSLTEKIKNAIEWICTTSIDGCVTGSAMLPDIDFDVWESVPDVDIFCYSEASLIHAVTLLIDNGYEPCGSSFATIQGEAEKIRWLFTRGVKKDSALSTVRLIKDGVKLNLSFKKHQTSVIDVISNFDMSIIMIGKDIQSGYLLDLRGTDTSIAVPNPLRKVSPIHSYWEVWTWVRQFDRVIKYSNRGYDTLPMARFYLKLIEEFLTTGALFLTDENKKSYETWSADFIVVKEKIEKWIEEREAE